MQTHYKIAEAFTCNGARFHATFGVCIRCVERRSHAKIHVLRSPGEDRTCMDCRWKRNCHAVVTLMVLKKQHMSKLHPSSQPRACGSQQTCNLIRYFIMRETMRQRNGNCDTKMYSSSDRVRKTPSNKPHHPSTTEVPVFRLNSFFARHL